MHWLPPLSAGAAAPTGVEVGRTVAVGSAARAVAVAAIAEFAAGRSQTQIPPSEVVTTSTSPSGPGRGRIENSSAPNGASILFQVAPASVERNSPPLSLPT